MNDPSDPFTARYRDPLGPLPSTPVIDALLAHRSVRAYLPDPLPAGALEAIVAAAQSAPTSSNLQAWSVLVTTDPARKARLAALAGGQAHIADCPTFLLFCADLARAARIGEAQQATLEGAALSRDLPGRRHRRRAGRPERRGRRRIARPRHRLHRLHAEPSPSRRRGVRPAARRVRRLRPLPRLRGPGAPRRRQAAPAAIHRAAPRALPARRRTGRPPRLRRPLRSFQAEQAMPSQGWRDLVLNRLGPIKRLSGRDKLRGVLNAMGFPLRYAAGPPHEPAPNSRCRAGWHQTAGIVEFQEQAFSCTWTSRIACRSCSPTPSSAPAGCTSGTAARHASPPPRPAPAPPPRRTSPPHRGTPSRSCAAR